MEPIPRPGGRGRSHHRGGSVRAVSRGRGTGLCRPVQFSPEACIALIHEAGGVAVLARPHTLHLPADQLAPLFERLVKAGLDGVEVYYGTHTPEETARYERLSEEWSLVESGGSDFHGGHKPGIDPGGRYGKPLRSVFHPRSSSAEKIHQNV